MNLSTAKPTVFLATRDATACRAFYEGTLGFALEEEDDFALVYQMSGAELRISKVPDFTPLPFTVLDWQVGDILETRAALASKGTDFLVFDGMGQDELGIWTVPGAPVRILWFKDPDCNTLSVSERG